ncbi:MAG: hypothetical protein LUG18_09955 [Candidatus Azobacteroides sp.]|nr:hypothetical protein [Candidatus Azobacteroides sp.]
MEKGLKRKNKVTRICLLLIAFSVIGQVTAMEDELFNDNGEWPSYESEDEWIVVGERPDSGDDDWPGPDSWNRDEEEDDLTNEDITRDDVEDSSDKDGKESSKDVTNIFIKSELTVKEMQDLLNKISSLMSMSPYFEQLFNYLINNYVLVANVKIDGTISSPAHFNSETNVLYFQHSGAVTLDRVVIEDFFHIYQHHFYNGIDKYGGKGHSNIEFEAKLFYDIHYSLSFMDCCIAIPQDSEYFNSYLTWLDVITNFGTEYPSWEVLEDKYYYFLEIFINERPEYNYPIDYTLRPEALLKLLNK